MTWTYLLESSSFFQFFLPPYGQTVVTHRVLSEEDEGGTVSSFLYTGTIAMSIVISSCLLLLGSTVATGERWCHHCPSLLCLIIAMGNDEVIFYPSLLTSPLPSCSWSSRSAWNKPFHGELVGACPSQLALPRSKPSTSRHGRHCGSCAGQKLQPVHHLA
jgi:hypothetical protein